MASDPYSKLIAYLKVLLPLIALGILSTVFLVSTRIEPGETIPFAEGEVADRIRRQQVTGSAFSGVTRGGDRIRFTAGEIVTEPDGRTAASDPEAQIDFEDGGTLWLEAERGDVDLTGDLATLTEDVVMRGTTGYVVRSDLMTSRLSELLVVSPGRVTAEGPPGDLEAGSMRIEEKESDGNAQLLFMDGVKLVYDPKPNE